MTSAKTSTSSNAPSASDREAFLLRRQLARARFDNERLAVGLKQAERLRDQNAKEKELQNTYNQLFLDNCPQLIIVLDRQLRYVIGTGNLNAQLGLPHHRRVKGATLEALFSRTNVSPDRLLRLETNCHRAMVLNQEMTSTERVSYLEGKEMYVNCLIAPVSDHGGACQGVIILQSDVTELTLAKEKAETATRTKSEFLAKMSHEIRTP